TMADMNILTNDAPAKEAHAVAPSTKTDDQILPDALDITPTNDNNPFVAPPLSDTVIEYVNTLGYPSTLRNVSAMKNLSTTSRGKKKTTHLLIPSIREIFDMPIHDSLLTDEIKKAPYYGEYQEHVAKYQQHLDAEHGKTVERGATKSSKATKVTKPKAAKATKPPSDPKPKPAPTQPPKAVPEKNENWEPDSGRFQPLLEVQGKGKEKRRTPSGPVKSPSLDALLSLTDSETESDDEVPKIKTRDQDEGQAGPNPSIQDEGQFGPNPSVQGESHAGSNPGDTTGSQPQSSHVVHVVTPPNGA
nr:hypothetical protein [Tanacetum cinerariifolium]